MVYGKRNRFFYELLKLCERAFDDAWVKVLVGKQQQVADFNHVRYMPCPFELVHVRLTARQPDSRPFSHNFGNVTAVPQILLDGEPALLIAHCLRNQDAVKHTVPEIITGLFAYNASAHIIAMPAERYRPECTIRKLTGINRKARITCHCAYPSAY